MFKSTDYIHNINDVPSAWIFEHYLKTGKLKGQSIKKKSIFNEKDSNPSLVIYYNHRFKKYMFKDFSTGVAGSAVNYMMKVWNCTFSVACNRIMKDYRLHFEEYEHMIDEDVTIQGWKVTEFKTRKWNKDDLNYWSQYKITQDLLELYNVKPLKFYKMSLLENKQVIEDFIVKDTCIYGYFYGNEEGNLAKIYQPCREDRKFIKVTNYVQGLDQCNRNDLCIIASSLKDILALKTIGIRADFVAPDSENTILTKSVINTLKRRYIDVITIFDNDTPGINAMKKYKDLYKLRFCYLPYEKDPAEILKNHSIDECQRKIVPKINKILND
ncbi:MAG: hypothetical protein EOL97_08590 [Spirochaetia bacterium]|nr:hypothetical protein [Spirochaetia bacterium]